MKQRSKTLGDDEVAELFLNKPSGLLGNAARVPAQEVSEEQDLSLWRNHSTATFTAWLKIGLFGLPTPAQVTALGARSLDIHCCPRGRPMLGSGPRTCHISATSP